MSFLPSIRQEKIFDVWENEEDNILVEAAAGTGKTSTLMEIVSKCKKRVLFLAFNKSIQEEITETLSRRGLGMGKAMTLHSLGLKAIRNRFRNVNINKSKTYLMVRKLQDQNPAIFKKLSWKDKFKLTFTLMDMNDISRLFLTEDIPEIASHFRSLDKNFFSPDCLKEVWELLLELRESYYKENTLEIDFIDMMYLPVLMNMYIPIRPYYLMVDECQDLNLCQHKFIDNLIGQGDIKRWIAVGDPRQSIYGFSGAYSSSFNMFLDKGKVVKLPLDICYRCDTSIVEAANEVYNIMTPFKKTTGIVETTTNITTIKQGAMVICRNTGPLIKLFFYLIREKRNCYIKGEDILSGIVRFAKPYKFKSIASAIAELESKSWKLMRDESDKGKYKSFIHDQNLDNFKILSSLLCKKLDKVEVFLNSIDSIFSEKADAIVLSTIHKSKGLEADVVYILNEKLIPSKFAKSDEQFKQEMNLKYVARTRAKKELYYLNI